MTHHPTVYIVEDEFIHRETLKIALEENGYICVGESSDADKAFDDIRRVQPQIVLLDIALPGINNGITLAKRIREELTIPHIFTTSFSDDTIIEQALATHPVGYLHKPVDAVSLKAMVQTALSENTTKITTQKETPKNLFIKIGEKLQKIELDDILVIKSDGNNYISILTHNKELFCRTNLKDIQHRLSSDFIRVHRAFYINLKHVETYNEHEQTVYLKNRSAPVARSYQKTFLSLLNKI